jgi:hypothetical protein
MMKKLLILMLVLGLASFANAAILTEISYNGQTNGTENTMEVTIHPSDTVTIDIYNPGGNGMNDRNFTDYLDFQYPSEGCYSLSGAVAGPAYGDFNGGISFVHHGADDYDEYTVIQSWKPTTNPPDIAGAIFLVNMHCEKAPNTVYVTLYDTRVNGGNDIMDTLIIHQVPEPMTLTLLGLGGLLLRRRK